MPFPFEKLEVYQRALRWLKDVQTLLASHRNRIEPTLKDQLFRASLSISLNIAEGNGRWHKPDKRQFFWIARGSVFECVPILQILKDGGVMSESEYYEYYRRLEEMAKMITGLIQFTER